MDKLLPYFSFQGRTNRQRYWLTTLAMYVAVLLALLPGLIPVVGWVFSLVAVAAFIVASVALAVRRLHDRGKSGWWLVAMYVPLLLLSVLRAILEASNPDVGAGFSVLTLPFSLWIFVELGCLKGTTGPNRFGPDPLQPAELAEVFS